MPNATRFGSCRCGQVRFQITAPPLLTTACHCTGCQKMTASAFALSVGIPTEGFAVIAGEPVVGGLRGKTQHLHCPFCFSWMFTRPEGLDTFVNVRTAMLDDARLDLEPFVETWTREKLPWVTTPAKHSFETLPPFEAWPSLIAEYAHAHG